MGEGGCGSGHELLRKPDCRYLGAPGSRSRLPRSRHAAATRSASCPKEPLAGLEVRGRWPEGPLHAAAAAGSCPSRTCPRRPGPASSSALALAAALARHLDEALVEAEVVADAILPALLVLQNGNLVIMYW